MYQFDGIIKIRNGTGESIFTARPNLKYGKFYDAPDKDKEILPRDIEGLEIKDNEHLLIHICGRDQELSGTTGTIDLDDVEDQYIATLYWDVPFGSKTNTFSVSGPGRRSKYIIAADGYNRSGTGLGTADVEVTKRPTT
ncbi:hypothetical protein N7492_003738 [Penicillium capsulatum]|uniref:Uncharacterized protein n=1 Tax=Penicillium capsulatum TaxID=69766 RepID=A0A9W9ILT3_9EURO|nr:hypothetical protein N7492_003738 [Penicillium capsulatum]KAJ6121680.1 hypothetical protein N7512_004145 [Penicillium capsulatum]